VSKENNEIAPGSGPAAKRAGRPYKRLSLTMPSVDAAETGAALTTAPPAPSDPAPSAPSLEPAAGSNLVPAASLGPVRVMAYLSEAEAELLDQLWLSLRRHPQRPSKSDLLRAAFRSFHEQAADNPQFLSDILSERHDSTLVRQRRRR
jgi:hypothetical protein